MFNEEVKNKENILKLLEEETSGKCYTSFKYCADDELRLPTISYEDTQSFTILKDRYGETDTTLKETKNLTKQSSNILKSAPLFSYFLDGSRRTYKVDDIEINRRIYPIMAGQIGVACCERISPSKFSSAESDSNLILSLPAIAASTKNPDLFLNLLKDKINAVSRLQRTRLKFSKIVTYSSAVQDESSKYENLGIATIQDEMIECEKKIVAYLYTKHLLSQDKYLLKDGSLQYKPMKTGEFKELTKFKNHYRRVVGVSKLFNPELCKDRSGKSNADKIARLGLYHRTPAYMYQDENFLGDVKFCIWYVRIRDTKRTASPFSGVLKIEKILITDDEVENGLATEEVDLITANIINERNPVCYGRDSRWANHLYPIYLTETFIKSKYLSDLHFLNLF